MKKVLKIQKRIIASSFGTLESGQKVEFDLDVPRHKLVHDHLLEHGVGVPLEVAKPAPAAEGKGEEQPPSSPPARASKKKTAKKRASKSTSRSRSTTQSD